MKAYARYVSVLGAMGLAGIVTLAAAGCGGDDVTVPGAAAGAGAGGEAEAGSGGDAAQADASAGAGAGGSGGDADGGESGGGGDAGAIELPAPWDEHSRHIELDCFAYFSGPMRFSAARDQLSAKQLKLVAGLRRVDLSDECSNDQLGCNLVITNDDGDVEQYVVDEYDGSCERSAAAVAYDSIEPFIDEIGCKFAREPSSGPLSASVGCIHGMHADAPPSETHQQLDLADTHRPYHVEVELCPTAEATVELLGADPAVPLAVGIPLERGAASKFIGLDVEVEAPIVADLVIRTTANCPSGDFSLTFQALE